MRLMLIGDIVGKPGRELVVQSVGGLCAQRGIDLIVANAENAAGGSGLTPDIYYELIAAGVDCITMGDHVYRRRDIFSILDSEHRIIRPANYPQNAPGRGHVVVRARNGVQVAVINVLGRVFMPPVDCPLRAVEQILAGLGHEVKVVLIDYHAEATSDKQVMSRYFDGRVSAVLGTHTHVTTADERILPGGTAFQCDVGMTGPHDSIIGRRVDRVLETTWTFRPTQFEVASGDCVLHGTIVEVDPATGRATAIERLAVTRDEAERLAAVQGPRRG